MTSSHDWASTVGWNELAPRLRLWPGGRVVVAAGTGSEDGEIEPLARAVADFAVSTASGSALTVLAEDKVQAKASAKILRPLRPKFAGGIDVLVAPMRDTIKWATPKPNLIVGWFSPAEAGRFLHRAMEEVAKDGMVLVLSRLSWLVFADVHRACPMQLFIRPDRVRLIARGPGELDAWFLWERGQPATWTYLQ